MRRIHAVDTCSRRRAAAQRRAQCASPSTADGIAASTRLNTLAQACAPSLPSLQGIPTEYSHEEHAELLYALCAALTREGWGTVTHWNESGQQSLVFAGKAIMRAIGKKRSDLLKRNVEFQLRITDTLDRFATSSFLQKGQLALTVECSGCGYLRIGRAIVALEAETDGLGTAFYWELLHAIYRVERIYDHQDALQYEEQMRDWASEEEESQEHYEFPEVATALPACIQRSLDVGHNACAARRLLRQTRGKTFSRWFDRLRKMQCLARVDARSEREIVDYYDSPPLPALLIAFEEHDAITACFDEEGQHMLEGTPEPVLAAIFDPEQPEDVKHAVRTVARFVLFNQELFELVEDIAQWEKDYGRASVDRPEPSLRAA